MNEVQPQPSHDVIFVIQRFGVVGECQENDSVITGRGDLIQLRFGRLTGGRQQR